jgi:hypothetical protein
MTNGGSVFIVTGVKASLSRMEVAWDGECGYPESPPTFFECGRKGRQREGEGGNFMFESHGYGAVACTSVIDGTRLSRSKGGRSWIRGGF